MSSTIFMHFSDWRYHHCHSHFQIPLDMSDWLLHNHLRSYMLVTTMSTDTYYLHVDSCRSGARTASTQYGERCSIPFWLLLKTAIRQSRGTASAESTLFGAMTTTLEGRAN